MFSIFFCFKCLLTALAMPVTANSFRFNSRSSTSSTTSSRSSSSSSTSPRRSTTAGSLPTRQALPTSTSLSIARRTPELASFKLEKKIQLGSSPIPEEGCLMSSGLYVLAGPIPTTTRSSNMFSNVKKCFIVIIYLN